MYRYQLNIVSVTHKTCMIFFNGNFISVYECENREAKVHVKGSLSLSFPLLLFKRESARARLTVRFNAYAVMTDSSETKKKKKRVGPGV